MRKELCKNDLNRWCRIKSVQARRRKEPRRAAANDSNAARADLDTPDVKVIYAQILRAGCTEEVLYSINVRSGKGHHGAILRDTGN